MENNPKKIDRKLYNKVSPDLDNSKFALKLDIKSSTEPIRNLQPINLEDTALVNQDLKSKTYSTNLYHLVNQVPVSQQPQLDVFCDYDLIVRFSKLSRVLILLKILFSVYYFYVAPVSLLILLPELFGYIGTKYIRNRLTLFYSFWLFIELIIRVIIIILLGVQLQLLPTTQIIVFSISIPVVPINVVQILVLLKFFNQIAHLEGTSKKTVLNSLSKSYCPP